MEPTDHKLMVGNEDALLVGRRGKPLKKTSIIVIGSPLSIYTPEEIDQITKLSYELTESWLKHDTDLSMAACWRIFKDDDMWAYGRDRWHNLRKFPSLAEVLSAIRSSETR